MSLDRYALNTLDLWIAISLFKSRTKFKLFKGLTGDMLTMDAVWGRDGTWLSKTEVETTLPLNYPIDVSFLDFLTPLFITDLGRTVFAIFVLVIWFIELVLIIAVLWSAC
jgi:hypothetical protein